MFIYIKHGDNEQFLVNTNCPVIVVVQYIKSRLGLLESELLDLCDDQGVLKFLFLPQNLQESSRKLLKTRESFIVCIINCTPDGAYTSVTSLLSGVDSALLETLQNQIDILEKTRLQQLLMESRMATSEEINAQALPTKSSKKRKKVTHGNAPDEEVQRHSRDRKSRA